MPSICIWVVVSSIRTPITSSKCPCLLSIPAWKNLYSSSKWIPHMHMQMACTMNLHVTSSLSSLLPLPSEWSLSATCSPPKIHKIYKYENTTQQTGLRNPEGLSSCLLLRTLLHWDGVSCDFPGRQNSASVRAPSFHYCLWLPLIELSVFFNKQSSKKNKTTSHMTSLLLFFQSIHLKCSAHTS